jgi:hypothetical protein
MGPRQEVVSATLFFITDQKYLVSSSPKIALRHLLSFRGDSRGARYHVGYPKKRRLIKKKRATTV